MSTKLLPTNFLSRRETQQLAERLVSLHSQLSDDPDLRCLIRGLVSRLSAIDGILAERATEYADKPAYERLFETGEAKHEWMEAKHCIHTANGLFFLAIGQEVMIIPGSGGARLGSGRFRLTLGSPNAKPIYATELRHLRGYAEEYMARYKDVMPGDTKYLLERVFGEEDLPQVGTEAAHAL